MVIEREEVGDRRGVASKDAIRIKDVFASRIQKYSVM